MHSVISTPLNIRRVQFRIYIIRPYHIEFRQLSCLSFVRIYIPYLKNNSLYIKFVNNLVDKTIERRN